jgi:hypothetical protein
VRRYPNPMCDIPLNTLLVQANSICELHCICRPVLFVSSHCKTDSNREGVAIQLNNTIRVTFKGSCGQVSCHTLNMSLRIHGLKKNIISEEYTYYCTYLRRICSLSAYYCRQNWIYIDRYVRNVVNCIFTSKKLNYMEYLLFGLRPSIKEHIKIRGHHKQTLKLINKREPIQHEEKQHTKNHTTSRKKGTKKRRH